MRARKLVVAALVREGGRILLSRRRADQAMPNLWEFPGGKVEPGEHPEAALVREVREELGCDIEVEAHPRGRLPRLSGVRPLHARLREPRGGGYAAGRAGGGGRLGGGGPSCLRSICCPRTTRWRASSPRPAISQRTPRLRRGAYSGAAARRALGLGRLGRPRRRPRAPPPRAPSPPPGAGCGWRSASRSTARAASITSRLQAPHRAGSAHAPRCVCSWLSGGQ